MVKRYKFLRLKGKTIKSENGDCVWKIGEWKEEEDITICHRGFHCSKTPYQAFSCVQGEVLSLVECRGESIIEDDKECWSEQRIVKAYRWTKKDSLKLAIFSAELVLKNFEKKYPNDLRPRQAIEAAKKVLFKDTKENRIAARSAAESAWSAAWSAAESAARSAWSAWSAWSAAESAARSAARSAAESAWSAAWSAAESAAWSAARSAAESAAIKNIEKYFLKIINELEEIK